MLLRDLMWEIFQSTGHIGAYLAYRSFSEADGSQGKTFSQTHADIT
ncbi:MAG: hypothetical protein ABFC84_11345 [Veillonellales bacterium]